MAQAATNERYPRPRLDKLGVTESSIVSVINVEDETFRDEVQSRTKTVSFGRTRKGSTLILYGVTELSHLDRLTTLRDTITQDGAIWVLWPKGRKTLREDDVRRAAIAQGLVDVKVMAFSDVLSGLKLVIPLKQREKPTKSRSGR